MVPEPLQDALELTCRALAHALTDEDWTSVPAVSPGAIDAALPALAAHGLIPALAQRLRGTPTWVALSSTTREELEDASRLTAARELAARATLADALAAFARAGIDTLVIKGEALAHQVYPAPALRERCDADLWVRAGDFQRAGHALLDLGFRARTAASGEWLQPELSYVRPGTLGAVPLDLHRRLFGQALLAAALPFEPVYAAARSVGAMRVPSPAHALLIATLHRVAHHAETDARLLWFWDVHLLCTRFPDAVAEVAALARASRTAGLLGDTLERTRDVFGTMLDPALVEDLLAHGAHERSRRLLTPMSPARRWWFDLVSIPGSRARARFVAETFAPDAAYMRERFGAGRPLAWLYVRRAFSGATKALWRRK